MPQEKVKRADLLERALIQTDNLIDTLKRLAVTMEDSVDKKTKKPQFTVDMSKPCKEALEALYGVERLLDKKVRPETVGVDRGKKVVLPPAGLKKAKL